MSCISRTAIVQQWKKDHVTQPDWSSASVSLISDSLRAHHRNIKMKNLLMLFCSLILNGVFGADDVKVSVMEGDSVTLTINPDDIKSASNLEWTFKDTIIAKIDIENKNSLVEYPDERFRDRLKVERQTGSLTIKNITSEDSGEYKLQIRGKREIKKTFIVSVSEMSIMSLMEGDFFTLQPGVKLQTDDVIEWKFNGDVLKPSRVKNCDVNHQTGDLNIANIRRDQSGEYEVNVNGGSLMLHKTFRINVTELEPLSGVVGHYVVMHTRTEKQTDDVIEWTFERAVIAQFNRTSNDVSYKDPDGRFKDRLMLDHSGSLTITNIRSEDSGLYDVNINSSQHIIHKRFNVTVTAMTESIQRSHWEITGPVLGVVGFVLGLIVSGVFFITHKHCRRRNVI